MMYEKPELEELELLLEGTFLEINSNKDDGDHEGGTTNPGDGEGDM